MKIRMLPVIFLFATMVSNTLIAGELEERSAIKREVIGYFNAGNYKNLVQLAHEYRMGRSRTASGLWKLTLFYSGIHEAVDIRIKDENFWSSLKSKTEKWIKEYSLHPTPYIAHGIVMKGYAWKFRGRGWADTVPAQAWGPFYQHLNNAKAFLEKYKEIASIDPTWYEVMAMIGIGLNMNRTEFERIIDEGLEKEPLYYQLYFTALEYFTPKWYGSERDIEELANSAVARTKGQEGMGMYARIYWGASQTYGAKLFTSSNVVWEKMKKGIDDVLKRYPDQWNINNFALFACLANDREKASELFDLIKEPAILDVWKSQDSYLSYKFWAHGARATVIAKGRVPAENTVSEPIDNGFKMKPGDLVIDNIEYFFAPRDNPIKLVFNVKIRNVSDKNVRYHPNVRIPQMSLFIDCTDQKCMMLKPGETYILHGYGFLKRVDQKEYQVIPSNKYFTIIATVSPPYPPIDDKNTVTKIIDVTREE